MAVENTSSAYDLSLFEAIPKRKEKPALQVVAHQSAKRSLSAAFTPKALGSFAIVVTLLCLMIYNHVCLNELTGEINQLESEIVRLESEYTKSASQLESMVSLRVVAERAKNELGLDRPDQYQTEYIYLYEEDKINIADQPEQPAGIAQKAKLAFGGLFGWVEAYIN